MELIQDRVTVVLVRARNPLNIGAAARAMGNFGFGDLRVVNDYEVPFAEARSAIDAAPVLQRAQQFSSVAEAVADCSLVLGTTALGERKLLHPVDVLRDSALHAHDELARRGRVALLFGSEKTGLSNEEMSHCHRLLTIPMRSGDVSMNLGQAVAVCLYELAREAPAPRTLPQPLAAATSADIDRLQSLLKEALLLSEYDRRFPGNVDDEALRRLVHRVDLRGDDIGIVLGMLRQIAWKLRSPTANPQSGL